MDHFPITPPIVVKDTPNPRRPTTVEEACDYGDEAMRLGRPPPWRELWHRLTSLARMMKRSRRSANCASCWRRKICYCRTAAELALLGLRRSGQPEWPDGRSGRVRCRADRAAIPQPGHSRCMDGSCQRPRTCGLSDPTKASFGAS
jgi:hypothetical protein